MLHLFPGAQSAVTRQYPPNLHIGRDEIFCDIGCSMILEGATVNGVGWKDGGSVDVTNSVG